MRPPDYGKPCETRVPAAGHGGRHNGPGTVVKSGRGGQCKFTAGARVPAKPTRTPPPPPPPDTAPRLSQKAGEQPKTVRARLEQHRAKASCRMCHGVIDPIGRALENFDAIGQWGPKHK